MPKRDDTSKLDALLAAVTDERLGDPGVRRPEERGVRVERILLKLLRPDPVQPRRVLPERIHHAFHDKQLTPSQALRELVRIAQLAARQRGCPFSELMELLPDPDSAEPMTGKHTPEEALLRDLVQLALTIRDDGQVNPITVVDVSQGVTQQYRIETGERRYWAAWLLRDFLPTYEGDSLIDCIVVQTDQATIFRQAQENTARKGLTAVALARQAALLLLAVNGYEIPDHAVNNDFYRQALDLRIPRGQAEPIYAAMGGIDKVYFSYIKRLLLLCDDALELADRYRIDEGVLRPVTNLAPADQIEIIQQIIQFGLTGKQVESIIKQEVVESEKQVHPEIPQFMSRFVRSYLRDAEKLDPDLLWSATCVEQGDSHTAHAYLTRLAELARSAANKYEGSG